MYKSVIYHKKIHECTFWTRMIISCLDWEMLHRFRAIFRAAAFGNLEALIKLGIAYLYNEGCKFQLFSRLHKEMYLLYNYKSYSTNSRLIVFGIFDCLVQLLVILRVRELLTMERRLPRCSVVWRVSPLALCRSPGSSSGHHGPSGGPAARNVSSITWKTMSQR